MPIVYAGVLYTNHSCTKIRQTVTVRGKKIQRACTILTRDKLSLDDYDDMKNFNKTAAADYNEAGKFLKIQIGSYISFYQSIRTQATCKDGNQVENVDTFLQNFTRHYEQNNTFRSSLVVCLMKAFVAKCDGAKNQPYEAKVLNFMLALSASGDRKAFEYVSANLCSVSLRHIERLTQARRPAPFIGISQSEIVIRLRQHFDRIRLKRKQAGSSRTRVAFSVGFDGTVLVKSYQILHSSNVIVGGAYPNHYIPIPDNFSGDELCTFLKGCVDGKLYGEPAAEIKVCVVSIQDTHGLSPYFTLVGRPQSINENNDFGKTVMEACAIACKEDGDATILNTTTDGVSSEVQWNLRVMFGFLSGQIGYVSLPDTNHNVKNARYQLIGGSSSTVLGSYVFDPWYLKLAGINQKLWRIDDFASDAVVLSLASVKTIQALQSYTEAEGVKYDIGNYAVTVVSLVFLRLRAYAVNANGLRWRDRALYSFITFLWFSSIQCSTMLANKRNLLLETFGVMFLVSRSDVAQPRRTTSECNEHTYGMWRMQLREFNIEQLIRIVQKAAIKLDSLFESGLEISRKNAGLSGYQATLPGFLNSLATAQAREERCGPVDVDPSKEVVHQLWDDVKGVIEQGIAVMLPFLRKFGAVEGNGLSPFATKIETPSDLQKMILAYFATASVLVSTPSDKNLQHGSNNNMPGIIGSHINDIQSTTETTNPSSIVGDDDNVEVSAIAAGSGDSDGDGDWEEEGNEHVISFDPPSYKGKTTFDYFMMLLQTDQLCDVGLSALKLIELLQLGKLDKGAVSTSGSGKFNSLSGRWFSAKKVSTGTGIGNTNLEEDGMTMIRRDSIITLNAKNMDKVVSEQDFRVLSIYHKHNNKWYMDIADEVVWNPKKMKEMKTRRIMASMVRKVGTEDFEDVRTDSLGQWSHSAVYCVAGLNDVVKVVGNIIVTQQQDA